MSRNQSSRLRGDVFDLGVIELDAQDDTEKDFIMPYDGFIYRVDASWPAGSNNAIGFNLEADVPEVQEGAVSERVREYVEETRFFMPSNHPNPEYLTDDNEYIPFYLFQYVPEGVKINSNIRNESTSKPLDLQVRVNTMNVDPREVGLTGGGV